MKFIPVKQGSPEWLEWRRSKITATDAAIILGSSPYSNIHQLRAEKLDLIDRPPMNFAMQRGKDLEDEARQEFEEMTGYVMIPRVVEHTTHSWMGASCDGIDVFGQHLLEIKNNGKKNHKLATQGIIPSHHYPQIQHQLEVTGLNMCYYFSFNGKEGVIVRVFRDAHFIEKMIEKEMDFYEMLQKFAS